MAAGQLVHDRARIPRVRAADSGRAPPEALHGGHAARRAGAHAAAVRPGRGHGGTLRDIFKGLSVRDGAAARGAVPSAGVSERRRYRKRGRGMPRNALRLRDGGLRQAAGGAVRHAAAVRRAGHGKARERRRRDGRHPRARPGGRIRAHGRGHEAGLSAARGGACPARGR